MITRLWRLFLRAGWAPFAVLVLHQIVGRAGWREHTDWLLHSLGGLAIAFFLYHAIDFAFPKLAFRVRAILTFTSACTAALFWELGEFASDVIVGTRIQHTIRETMMDLVNGTVGASITLAAIIAIRVFRESGNR